jgi:hypothetical protein
MEVNAMYGITGEHYAIDDVFRFLELCPAVEARIDIEETGFKLFIGPREYELRRGCPLCLLSKDRVLDPLDGPQREDL